MDKYNEGYIDGIDEFLKLFNQNSFNPQAFNTVCYHTDNVIWIEKATKLAEGLKEQVIKCEGRSK